MSLTAAAIVGIVIGFVAFKWGENRAYATCRRVFRKIGQGEVEVDEDGTPYLTGTPAFIEDQRARAGMQ